MARTAAVFATKPTGKLPSMINTHFFKRVSARIGLQGLQLPSVGNRTQSRTRRLECSCAFRCLYTSRAMT
ncbi:conserved hypothetical protein [Thiomonas arsenitoxydans]|uniref:Uncharacterized protein n=2 Tax=Thiomonas arsenitoxydans (strain DSM 22701 / CIP 110005 / 3As) TaxID=426114 RepID=A0ABM9T8D9_THIA3|nr:conserved hypothetical protein [Thiomonas arsenitoxydans]CQR38443.1 conserved hypothetical protein [Thiomonas arsenitoxydans]